VDDFSAFASVVATLNNLGPGLGVVADNFASMNPVAKWILIANMLFGRLEVFTLLVLFTPHSGASKEPLMKTLDSFLYARRTNA
jgi:trk system potassium uptake protein TrkH